MSPPSQLLREQLGPGELDAACCVCRVWAAQLAKDVVLCKLCLPPSYEELLSKLERLDDRFRSLHSW